MFFPEPVDKNVVFAGVIEKSKSLPSNAVAPNGHFNDNRMVNVSLPLSGATTLMPENTIVVALTVPFATNVLPSNMATDCIASVQLATLLEPP